METRRGFLAKAATAVAYTAVARRVGAQEGPLGLPLGLQLYSVRELLPKDYAGTLKQIGALGYRDVEAAGFYGHSAAEVKQAMSDAGLRCVSAHYSYDALAPKLDEVLHFAGDLGLSYVICSSPGFKDASRVAGASYAQRMHALTMDDWRWNAEQFNVLGEKVKAAGMQFGYHNHTMEFADHDGAVPYDELLRLTDPAKVTMEMDCGWVVVGGKSPVEYLTRYPARFSMLHVKDFKKAASGSSAEPPPGAELGQGTIDYRPIFAAAKKAQIKHVFVEQEQFDMPPMESLRVDAEYMRKLKA